MAGGRPYIDSMLSRKAPLAPLSTLASTTPQKPIASASQVTASNPKTPVTFAPKTATHSIEANGSVQALVVDNDIIIAGLQGGDIVAWSLETYELVATLNAHEESVLSLHLSDDKKLLFSCGVDSVVNVWSTETFRRLHSIYSHYEVGDIFCLAYSSRHEAIFCGAQNAGIQWYYLKGNNTLSSPTSSAFPTNRKHKFFDSPGPGGAPPNRPSPSGKQSPEPGHIGHTCYFPRSNYCPFAHKSHISCMILVKGLFDSDADQEVLVTGGGDGAIKIWSVNTLATSGITLLEKFKNRGSSALSMVYSGFYLYVGLSNGVTHVYNLGSRQLVQKLSVPHGDISSIQILGGVALCGTSTGWVKKFDARFSEIGTWAANRGKILASAVTRRDNRDIFVTAGNDNTLAFWDVSECTEPNQDDTLRTNDELVNSLKEFISFRTIAANPGFVGDCHEAVTFLRKLFNLLHATTVVLPIDYGINPVLLARFDASQDSQSCSTIMFYGHYDIVDAEYNLGQEKDQWLADPFQLYPLNGYLYGRGATDNKGPILAALYAVADLVENRSLSCNVVFLLEGEEEVGSRGFQRIVRENRNRIGEVDYILLSNSYWLDDHIPCLTYGMRGVIHATVTVASDKPDQHSGMDGKSAQHEPLKDLTVLMASLTGPSGTGIMIPGFYAAQDDKDKDDLTHYTKIAMALAPGHPEIKNQKTFAESLRQRWREPNLTIHRIEVPEAKTAVTISRSAKATLSIRIVPNQDAEHVAESLTEFLKKEFSRIKSSNKLDVNITSRADAWLGDPQNQIFQALESAITEVWHPDPNAQQPQRSFPPRSQAEISSLSSPLTSQQKRTPHRRASSLASKGNFTLDNIPRKPLYIREGGSIPAISFLEREFRAPAAMFPMGQASDNAHLSNERIRVENLYKGREVLRRVFAGL